MREALKPFHNPKLRNTILAAKQSLEQVIDEQTKDTLLAGRLRRRGAGEGQVDADQLPASSSKTTRTRSRPCKVLYSRPYRAGLRYRQVKELAAAIQQPPHSASTPNGSGRPTKRSSRRR